MATMIPCRFINPNRDEEQNELEKLIFDELKTSGQDDWNIAYSFVIPKDAEEVRLQNNKENIQHEYDFIIARPNTPLIYLEAKKATKFEHSYGNIIAWHGDKENKLGEKVKEKNNKLIDFFKSKNILIDQSEIKFAICSNRITQEVKSLQNVFITLPEDPNNFRESIENLLKNDPKTKGIDASKVVKIKKIFDLHAMSRFREKYVEIFEERKRFDQSLREIEAKQNEYWIDKDEGRYLFYGPGGTGKTAVLSLWANTMASKGKKVLYLCYNTLLKEKVASELEKSIHIMSHYDYFKYFIDKCSPSVKSELSAILKRFENKKWDDEKRDMERFELPRQIFEASKKQNFDKFDALFIDEAQDLNEDLWLAFKAAVKPDGGLFVLAGDMNQRDIRGKYEKYPKDIDALFKMCGISQKKELTHVIRSNSAITEITNAFRNNHMPEQYKPQTVILGELEEHIWSHLQGHMIHGGLTPSKWAIIIGGQLSNDQLGMPKIAGINNPFLSSKKRPLAINGTLIDAELQFDPRAKEGRTSQIGNTRKYKIPLITVSRARGLEFPCVLFINFYKKSEGSDSKFSFWSRHIAASRTMNFFHEIKVELPEDIKPA